MDTSDLTWGGYSSGLSVYWLLAAGNRTLQAAGTHVRTRERVWGSTFWDRARGVSRQLGVPLAKEEGLLRLPLPLAGPQPPQTASEEAQTH